MADQLEFQIIGNDIQLVEIQLDKGEGVWGEVGTMRYMEDGIEMSTSTGGGMLKGLKREVMGESFFITNFINTRKKVSRLGFSAPYPGKIIPLDLVKLGGRFICQKDSFLCAAQGVDVEIAFAKKLGAGKYGGEGFILQRLEGEGIAFVHAGGTVIEKILGPNQSLRVDTGCLVSFSTTIEYDIQYVGGFKNSIFGGEGLFFAKLTGPGIVYLQSLPLSRLADKVIEASKKSGGTSESASSK